MMSEYDRWLAIDDLDVHIKKELLAMNELEIEESFFVPLKFGTGGIRGILGAGTSKLNRYTVTKALTGYARYLQTLKANKGVAIAYDNRHFSLAFAELAASVLASHHIPSFVFASLRPTPVLSYTVRHLDLDGGIMITASHNPKEYNGLKMYDDLGGQLVPHAANQVIAQIDAIDDLFQLKPMAYADAVRQGYVTVLDADIDESYMAAVLSLDRKKRKKTLRIGFSPEHGTSTYLGPEILTRAGFQVDAEPAQSVVDPNFSATKSANPENIEAFEKLIALGKAKQSDILIATDPDADRIGVLVWHDGHYLPLSGNQTGVLLLDYVLTHTPLPQKPVVFSTIVSTDMAEAMTKKHGLNYVKTLTGFKYIGEHMELIQDSDFQFLFGFEESYGYILKDITRDKDALQAMLAVSLLADRLKKDNKTLIDQLETLYETYGYYMESLENIALKGIEGTKKINEIMADFRAFMPTTMIGKNLLVKEDFLQSKAITPSDTWTLNYPSDNVLKFSFKDFWFVLRPSGTEPKLKLYFMVKKPTKEAALTTLSRLKEEVLNRVHALIERTR